MPRTHNSNWYGDDSGTVDLLADWIQWGFADMERYLSRQVEDADDRADPMRSKAEPGSTSSRS